MDIRMYFQKIREMEDSIEAPYVVVISLDTGDGGRAGVPTEVTRQAAARLVVEGRVRLATPEETHDYYSGVTAAQERADHASLTRLRLALLADDDLRTRLLDKE